MAKSIAKSPSVSPINEVQKLDQVFLRHPGVMERISRLVSSSKLCFLRFVFCATLLNQAACDSNGTSHASLNQDADAYESDTAQSDSSNLDMSSSDIYSRADADDVVDTQEDIGPMAGTAPWPTSTYWPLIESTGSTYTVENFPEGYIDPVNGVSDDARIAIEVPKSLKPSPGALSATLLNNRASLEEIVNDPEIFDLGSGAKRWVVVADTHRDGEADLIINTPVNAGAYHVPYVVNIKDGVLHPPEPAHWFDLETENGNCSYVGNLDNDPKGREDIVCFVNTYGSDQTDVRVYYSTYMGYTDFKFTTVASANAFFKTATASDINGDGYLDLMIANSEDEHDSSDGNPSGNLFFLNNADGNNGQSITTFRPIELEMGPPTRTFHIIPGAENYYIPQNAQTKDAATINRPTPTAHNDGGVEQVTVAINVDPSGEVTGEGYNPFYNPKHDTLSLLHLQHSGLSAVNGGGLSPQQLADLKENMSFSFPDMDLSNLSLSSAHGDGFLDPMSRIQSSLNGNLVFWETQTANPTPGSTAIAVNPEDGGFHHMHRLNLDSQLTSGGSASFCWTATVIPNGANHTSILVPCGDDNYGSASVDPYLSYMANFISAPVEPAFSANVGESSLQTHVLSPEFTMQQTAGSYQAVFNPELGYNEIKWVDGESGLQEPGDWFSASRFVLKDSSTGESEVHIIVSKYFGRDKNDTRGFAIFKVAQQGKRFWYTIDTDRLSVPQNGQGAVVTVTSGDSICRTVVGVDTSPRLGNALQIPGYCAMGSNSSPNSTADVEVCWPGLDAEEACTTYTDLKLESYEDYEFGPHNPHSLK